LLLVLLPFQEQIDSDYFSAVLERLNELEAEQKAAEEEHVNKKNAKKGGRDKDRR